MIDELLPNAAYINLIDWDSDKWDICTETFDDFPDSGIKLSGTLGFLLETPKEFTICMTKRNTVSDILDKIQETYRNSLENPIEEEYFHDDLIITSLSVDLDTKTINVKFLGQ